MRIPSFKTLTIWQYSEEKGITDITGGYEEITGYTEQDFRSTEKLWRKFIHPDDRTHFQQAMKKLDEKKLEEVNLEYRIVRKDGLIRNVVGTVRRVEKKGDVIFTGYIVDVTKDSKDLSLKHYKKGLSSLLQYSIEILFDTEEDRDKRVDTILETLGKLVRADRTYIFENVSQDSQCPILTITFEWCAPGVREKKADELFRNVNLYKDSFRWYKSMVIEKEEVSGPVRMFPSAEQELLKSNNVKSLLAVPVWYNGIFKGFIGFDDCNDERYWTDQEIRLLEAFGLLIWASWHYEKALNSVESKVDQLNLLRDEQESFLRMLSHQLKTPLSTIDANAEMLRQDSQGQNNVEFNVTKERIKRIKRSVRKLKDLVNSIIVGESSKEESCKLNPNIIKAVIFNTIDNIHTEENHKTEIVEEVNSLNRDLIVPINKKKIEYIFDVIIMNSIKYRSSHTAEITIKYRIDVDKLHLTFIDKGVGIKKDELENVGTPFFRGSNVEQTKGNGVGLSMVEKIVEGAKGSLKIDSELGEYTKVVILLPAREEITPQ